MSAFNVLTNPIEIASNLFIPEQTELGTLLQNHSFSSSTTAENRYPILGLSGQVAIADLIGGALNGSINTSDIVQQVVPTELGVFQVNPEAGDQENIEVAMNTNLDPHPGCNVSNLPEGSDVICLALGEWEGRNGTGTLFPMGMNVKTRAAFDALVLDPVAPVRLPLSTVASENDFVGIGYLSAALALDLNNSANGTSAVFNREIFSPDNANAIQMNSFFNQLNLRYDSNSSLAEWNEAMNANSPHVSFCEVEISIEVYEAYNSGVCGGDQERFIKTVPFWRALVSRDSNAVAFPFVPASWPRANSNAWILPAEIRVNRADISFSYKNKVSLTCNHLGLEPEFDFHLADFGQTMQTVTHTSTDFLFLNTN